MRENPNRRAKYGVADDSTRPLFNLPKDISMSVFSKLPVNSILSCRCVCTQWRRLLSDPEFVTMHLNHSQSRNKFLFPSDFNLPSYYLVEYEESNNGNYNTAPLLRLDLPLEGRCSAEILGSCNGLLCVSIRHVKEGHPNNYKIVLWNPSTRDYKMLPDANPIIDTFSDLYGRFMLVGFGYDSFSRDYKLVRASFVPPYQVDVYSLKTNSWKVIESALLRRIAFSPSLGGVEVNGSIYWLISFQFGIDLRGIMAFDLKDEKFTELQCPPINIHGLPRRGLILREMGGYLGVYCCYWRETCGDAYVGLWMMRKEGKKDEWTKLMFMSCREMGRIRQHFVTEYPICSFENGKALFYMAEFNWPSRDRLVLKAYDPKLNNVVGTVPFYGFSDCHNWNGCKDLVAYFDTLVSPNASFA